ncbi:MAG: FAD-binding oxidoreductase [Rhizobiales bacterium]|nr:FAD-binding oxidoreductase [Hyphomicrobiales bacterium]MBI3674404.1 FAD-binding oxidoreductase [Hyphomicrobiales bacterium]
MTVRPSQTTLDRLAAVVGEAYAIRDPAAMDGYLREWRDLWHGTSPMVLRPANTGEVSRLLAIADETLTAIVPQSGNTGLVGGQVPHPGNTEVLLSLDRMTRIVDVDAADNTMIVEAGATLKSVQDAAEAAARLFPLSLASEGSCRIGGNLSSNAGGVNMLAYGNARDLCLGIEVVLAGGRVWDGMKRLRKDNSGYDLKNLFIGAEGTLGVITGAVLKLSPRPERYETGFIAVPRPQAAVELLALARGLSGNRVVAFELIPRLGVEFTVRHMGARDPLPAPSPWYILAELADAPEGTFTEILGLALERGIATDAVVAQSGSQREALWALREKLSESQKFEGGSIKHDIAVPVSKVPQFLAETEAALKHFMAGLRIVAFGHLGDGNIHYNVSQPIGMEKQAYLAGWDAMNAVVFDVVLRLGGSISAEHGIGQLKRAHMPRIKQAVELEMMKGVKRLLDPKGIMNPGKVLPD